MDQISKPPMITDPAEFLDDVLGRIWRTICCTYDAGGCMPEVKTLFAGVDLSKPFQAAKAVLGHMLLEAMENVGRFSPWYSRPARAFGLISIRDPYDGSKRWMLAAEAMHRWEAELNHLAKAIDLNYSLIRAMLLVEDLLEQALPGETWLLAYCACDPPRSIQVTGRVLGEAKIVCDACLQTFEVQSSCG